MFNTFKKDKSADDMDDEDFVDVNSAEYEDAEEDYSTTASKSLMNDINIVSSHDSKKEGVESIVVDASLDETTDRTTTQLETLLKKHMAPIQKALDDHVQPHIRTVQAAIDEHSKKTQSLVDHHVTPSIQYLSKGTQENWMSVQTTTQGFMEDHLSPKWQSLQQNTARGVTVSGQFFRDVPTHSKRVLDDHVVPTVGTWKTTASRTVSGLSDTTQTTLGKVAPLMDHWQSSQTKQYYWNTAPGLVPSTDARVIVVVLEASLRGMGHVLLCDNPLTGGLILVALWMSNPLLGLCAALSVISSTVCSLCYLQMEVGVVSQVGRNAVLVGAGSVALLQFDNMWLGGFVSLFLSAVILPPVTLLVHSYLIHSLLPQDTPALLLPSNIVMVLLLLATMVWEEATVVAPLDVSEDVVASYSMAHATLNGISSIFFLENATWSGLLMMIGVLLCSRWIAGALIAGSLLASMVGLLVDMPTTVINAGMAGYQVALTSAAMVYYFEPSKTEVAMGVVAIVFTGLIQAACDALFVEAFGAPLTLSFGYCFAILPFLSLNPDKLFGRTGLLRRIPEAELSTPEEYYYGKTPTTTTEAKEDLEDDNKSLTQPNGGSIEVAIDETPTTEKGTVVANEETPLITKVCNTTIEV